ncbi:MAG: FkbM family methyltransferase [Synechococcaceae cyanobacterium]|jgi:FkbM family methyltransferase
MIPTDLLIFGAGSYARKLAKAFQAEGHKIHAFVSSRTPASACIDDLPCYSFSSLPSGLRSVGPIACGVFNRGDAYHGLSTILNDNGFHDIIWPWNYYPELHQQLGWSYWMDAKPRDLQSWQLDPGYQEVMKLLSDDESRTIIDRVIAFRCGADLEFSAFKSDEEQYFNDITLQALPKDRPINYLDVGAFNGDTLEHLCAKASVGMAILFEPDPINFSHLITTTQKLTTKYPQLQPIALPLGAGSEYSCIVLEASGEASSLHAQGQTESENVYTVTVNPLDNMMPAVQFDLVKIDVEGHDREAILGMQAMLKRAQPVVAVSLYHRPHDFVDLTLFLRQTLSDLPYKFYVRQHLYNSFETVLYAIPERS